MARSRPVVVNGRFLGQPLSGVQRYASEMLSAVGKIVAGSPVAYPSITVVAPKNIDLPESHGGGVRYTSAGRFGGNAWVQAELPRIARDATLWSPTNTGPLFGRVVGEGRHVVTIHDAAAFDHPEWFSRKFAAWYGFMLPRVARSAGHVLTVSDFSKERLMATLGLQEEKVTVVYPAADTTRFRPLPQEEIAAALDALKLEKPYVLALGSLEPRKNLPALISSWRSLCGKLPEGMKLFVVGGRASVFRDAGIGDLPPDIVLGGFIPDEYLPALYCGAEAFVYPSLYEGFGLPPLEALACGTPVATSNVASLPEVVGNAALLVDPDSPQSIADGIEKILGDTSLRKKLAESGPERAARFDWQSGAGEVLDLLIKTGER